MANPLGVPLPTVRRLPFYLQLLKKLAESGEQWVSSDLLGNRLGLGAIQVRKDLAAVGAEGSPRRGFPVPETIGILSAFLGSDDYADIFLIGATPLGAALLSDANLSLHGFKVLAVFDANPALAGFPFEGHQVLPLSKLPGLVSRMGVRIAVLASSSADIDAVEEAISQSGLKGIFDLTGLPVTLPESMVVVRENFGSRLAALAGELSGRRNRLENAPAPVNA